jgi:hypothetical protein
MLAKVELRNEILGLEKGGNYDVNLPDGQGFNQASRQGRHLPSPLRGVAMDGHGFEE